MLQWMRVRAKYIWLFIFVAFVGGFLLVDTSGLLGSAPVTMGTPVAVVNGEDVPVSLWYRLRESLEQQETQTGRTLSLDDRERLANQAFEQLLENVLLRQEYKRRGIGVTADEIQEFARFAPPPQIAQSSDFQTDGQFDINKYHRYLASPQAKQSGILLQLEQFYREEIPKQKLFEQVVSDVYLSDNRLWMYWKDAHDSAQVSYIAFNPALVSDSGIVVTDAEVRDFYEKHKKQFDRPGRAMVSVLAIPRTLTAADTAASRAKASDLRNRIAGGEKFEDVARAESADSISGAAGGDLGRGGKGRFVPEFETAAYALAKGELSQPVLSPFGFHIIRVDDRKGDTLSLRHILVRVQQRDSAAAAVDRRADSLANLAASATDAKKFDQAAHALRLTPIQGVAIEGELFTPNGQYIPSVSAWAFGGAKPGESSELFDSEDGYYLARLDSLVKGGQQSLSDAQSEIRNYLATKKKIDRLAVGQAQQVAVAARNSTLEQAATAAKLTATKTEIFSRMSGVPGIGRANEAIGAAFMLPVGAISAPIKTDDAVFVIRVDRRVEANRTEFDAQRVALRTNQLRSLQQARFQEFLRNLREESDVKDRRPDIEAATRRSQ